MPVVKVKISGLPAGGNPDQIRSAFSRKNMPKLYRYIEVATKQALGDKSSLPLVYGRTAFYDSDRSLTGKTGPHLQSQYQTRTETGPDSEQLVVSNKKNVGGWNVFWMLTDGTRFYNTFPKLMKFYDRYGSFNHTGPGFRQVRFRRGNEAVVPVFNKWLDQQVQKGVDKGVQTWDITGAAQSEFARVLKNAGFKVTL